MEQLRFAVLGAGHGGMAMAGHLGLMEYSVKMFNRSEARLTPIRFAGEITLAGELEGSGKIELATANIAAVAAALGIRAMTAKEWLYVAYDAHGKTLYDAIKNNAGYKGILAPSTVDHRYLWEDVPMSLVPIASMGDLLGVETPATKHIIQLASLMNGCDYWAEGRTVEKMGLAKLTHKEIRRIALEGFQ